MLPSRTMRRVAADRSCSCSPRRPWLRGPTGARLARARAAALQPAPLRSVDRGGRARAADARARRRRGPGRGARVPRAVSRKRGGRRSRIRRASGCGAPIRSASRPASAPSSSSASAKRCISRKRSARPPSSSGRRWPAAAIWRVTRASAWWTGGRVRSTAMRVRGPTTSGRPFTRASARECRKKSRRTRRARPRRTGWPSRRSATATAPARGRPPKPDGRGPRSRATTARRCGPISIASSSRRSCRQEPSALGLTPNTVRDDWERFKTAWTR